MAQQARLTPPNPSASELILQTLSLTTLASHRHAPALALDHTLPKMLFPQIVAKLTLFKCHLLKESYLHSL